MPNKCPHSDEESSDLPERISLPRHAPKQSPVSKKPKLRPEEADAVSYSSDSDKEKATKAKTSGKRLSFGTVEVEGNAAAGSVEPGSKRTRKPSEKVLYMVDTNKSESDSQKPPSKDRQSIATPTSSKRKAAYVSDSWEEWSDSNSAQLSKNDRNAAPSKPAPKEEQSKSNCHDQKHGTSPKPRHSEHDATPTPEKRKKEIEPSSTTGRIKKKCRSLSPTLSNQASATNHLSDDAATPMPTTRGREKQPSSSRNKDRERKVQALSPSRSVSSDSVVEILKPKHDDPVTPKKRVKQAEPSPKRKNREKAQSPSPSLSDDPSVHKRERNYDDAATPRKHHPPPKSNNRGRAFSLSPSNSPSPPKRAHGRDHDHTVTPKKGGSASKAKISGRARSHSPSPSISPSRPKQDRQDKDAATIKEHRSSLKGNNRGRAQSLSPSLSNGSSGLKWNRDNDNIATPKKHRKDTDRPSSGQKDKDKARARSPSPSLSADSVEGKTPKQEPGKDGIDIEDVQYPDLPTSCKSLSAYIHLVHTFTLEGRMSNMLSPAAFYDGMEKKDRGSFLDTLNFTREGFFINPSRSRLNNLNVNKAGRLVFGRDDNALMLFNGAVAYCSLVEPTSINGANVRCISVYPFSNDFPQWKNFVASVVQKTDFITTTDNDVLSFMTKKENSTEDNGSSRSHNEPFSSPKKAGKFFQNTLKPGKETRPVSYAGKIPYVLSYNDKVPIFDARDSDFRLQKHYKEVGNLPHYKEGKEDLPQFAVVTVGHTMSTFSYNPDRSVTALQLNVVFVILHGFVKD